MQLLFRPTLKTIYDLVAKQIYPSPKMETEDCGSFLVQQPTDRLLSL